LAGIAISAVALVSGCKTHDQPVAYYSSGSYAGTPVSTDTYQSGAGATSADGQSTTGQMETAREAIIPLHQETVRVGTREVDAGSVRIRKVVKTETVNQPVQVRRETLVVDRLPGDASAQAAAPAANLQAQQQQQQQQGSITTPFQEGEMVIQLRRQEPVVETQIVPSGRIVAQTRVNTDQVNVQKQVRKEDVEVVRQGNAENVIISDKLQASTNPEAQGAPPAPSGTAAGAGAAAAEATQPITELSQVTGAGDKSALAGRPVRLTSAQVQSVSGDRTLLSVGEGQNRLWIRTGTPVEGIKEGDTIRVNGVLHTPAQSQTSFTEEIAQQLKSEPVYLEARSVEKAQ